jgi:hypothetical protein
MNPIVLNNTHKNDHKLKLCGQCNMDRVPEGGIELRNKWICHACWIKKMHTGKLKL